MKRWLLAALLLPLCAVAQSPEQNPLSADAVAAFKKGDYTTARHLFEAVLAQNPRDVNAQNYLKFIAIREKGGGAPRGVGIEASLRAIMIPKADFKDATVREAITYVSQQVKAITEGKQTMNIVWMIPSDYEARVTLSLTNVPAAELMKYIAESANVTLEYDAYAVKVKPVAVNTPMPAGAPAQP